MSNSFTAGKILELVYSKNRNRWPTNDESSDARQYPSDEENKIEVPDKEVKPLPVRVSPVSPRTPEKESGNLPTIPQKPIPRHTKDTSSGNLPIIPRHTKDAPSGNLPLAPNAASIYRTVPYFNNKNL